MSCRIPASVNLDTSSLIQRLLLQYGPVEVVEFSLFQSFQELTKVASMAEVEVVSNVLQECLWKMENLMRQLDVFVPAHVYLPAPPLFCPQGPQGVKQDTQSSE